MDQNFNNDASYAVVHNPTDSEFETSYDFVNNGRLYILKPNSKTTFTNVDVGRHVAKRLVMDRIIPVSSLPVSAVNNPQIMAKEIAKVLEIKMIGSEENEESKEEPVAVSPSVDFAAVKQVETASTYADLTKEELVDLAKLKGIDPKGKDRNKLMKELKTLDEQK